MKSKPGKLHTRRRFIKKTASAAAAISGLDLVRGASASHEPTTGLSIVQDADLHGPVSWAVERLIQKIAARGLQVELAKSVEQVPPAHECLLVTSRAGQ